MTVPPATAAALAEGAFVHRRNRFAADVRVDGRTHMVHVPNSGRMTELLTVGAPVLLRPAPAVRRRTAYDLVAAHYAGQWVGVDARISPQVVVEAWRRGMLPELAGCDAVRTEARYGRSRLDLRFSGPGAGWWVEAKSVNLVEDGRALFPDAPTVRGVRHLAELADAVRTGGSGAVAFVVQREDAEALSPHAAADPAFAAALRAAIEEGVAAFALACRFEDEGLTPARRIPVLLDG